MPIEENPQFHVTVDHDSEIVTVDRVAELGSGVMMVDGQRIPVANCELVHRRCVSLLTLRTARFPPLPIAIEP